MNSIFIDFNCDYDASEKNITITAPFHFFIVNAQDLSIKSPDGKIDMRTKLETHILWNVTLNNDVVIDKAIISMVMANGRTLGLKPKLRSKKTKSVNESLTTQIPN